MKSYFVQACEFSFQHPLTCFPIAILYALPPALLAAAQADISKWLASGRRIHNIAGQFPLSQTAHAHLAVEKGDKLGTVIVDCTR